ncbi:MAG: 30S ribosomal protein S6 [Candidatus Delongbacteria bacterium]|nr:30S ribosomal protein S6 [Candidatus Delongbacteria bacterium]
MKAYETLFIVKPQVEEKALGELMSKYENLMTKNQCQILKKENWGLRTLAYEIKKCRQGFYLQFHFMAPESFIKTLEHAYRIDENIIRYITVRLSPSEEKAYQPANPQE